MCQVAEMVVVGGGEDKERREIVGTIRGCIKTVTCGTKLSRNGNNCSIKPPQPLPVYTKLAYILGLRVSPSHRCYFSVPVSRFYILNNVLSVILYYTF